MLHLYKLAILGSSWGRGFRFRRLGSRDVFSNETMTRAPLSSRRLATSCTAYWQNNVATIGTGPCCRGNSGDCTSRGLSVERYTSSGCGGITFVCSGGSKVVCKRWIPCTSCVSGEYLDSSTESCVKCQTCPPAHFLAGCGGTDNPGYCYTTTSTSTTRTSTTTTSTTTASTTTSTNTSTTTTATNTSTTSTSTTTSSTSTTTSSTSTTTSSTSTTSSTTATKTDSMTQELYAIQASEQEALVEVLAFTSGTDPGSVIIKKPNTTMVTRARRIGVLAAVESGGFVSVTVSGNLIDGDGGGETNHVGAAIPMMVMIRQLAASGGPVVLSVTASKPPATEEDYTPGAAAGSAAGAQAEDAALPTEPTQKITLGPLVSVRVAVNGEWVSVRDLMEPILITVLPKKKAGFECGFYNETSLEWSSEGMWEHDAGNGALVCASTHLTVFAAIKKTWIGLQLAVTCIPAELLTAKGIASITRSNRWRLFGAVFLFVFSLSQAWACFLYQAWRQRYRPPLPNHEAVSFSYHFMSDRSEQKGGPWAQLQTINNYVFEDVRRVALAPIKTLRLYLVKDSVLQRVAKDLGRTAEDLEIMLQWGHAERSRRCICKHYRYYMYVFVAPPYSWP